MIARPSEWTSTEVAAAVGGEHLGPERRLAGVSTDTRDPLLDQLFVALCGDRFDAHDFLGDALAKGAGAILASRRGWARVGAQVATGGAAVILTDDTLFALGELGRAHRRRMGLPVLALTGSNGKTSTKELLAAILAVEHPVLKTEGNLNNLIGVPMTLLGLQPHHRVAVVEMGMNREGEIARYTEIAAPDLGMVINIGPAHIGELGSMEAIARAKGELFFGLDRQRAVAVVNADDPRVVERAARAELERVRTFGCGEGADVRLLEAEPADEGQRVVLAVDGEHLEAQIPLAGAHNALNAAAAVAAATGLPERVPVSTAAIVLGLASAKGAGRRLASARVGPFLVVDDSYNANSASMRAAIETVSEQARRRGRRFVAFLGEMRELGPYAEAEHAAVGEALARSGAAFAAVFGSAAEPLARAAGAGGLEVHHQADDEEALYRWAKARLRPGDVVLVKGSRGIRMERFIERLGGETS